MTHLAKQRLTLIALLAFAIWPLVHRGLVASYGITPWKFMGFAMYCVPVMDPVIAVHAHYGERRVLVDPSEAHLRDLRREVARFKTFRTVWGELLTPDPIGELTKSVLTRADQIEVVVTEGYLDRDTWRLAARETIYRYDAEPPKELSDPYKVRKRGGGGRRRGLD